MTLKYLLRIGVLASLAFVGAALLSAETRVPAPISPTGSPSAGVRPLPGNPARPLSERYSLTVGGLPVEVRAERFGFDVAMVDLPPAGAEFSVELTGDFSTFSLKPDRHGLAVKRDGRRLSFTLREPIKLVLQADALPPLAILATPPESAPPRRDDPKVLWFPPGVTVAGVIRPTSGQTIYLAPGALVKGRVEARDADDVAIIGRGILDTTGYSRREDKTHGVLFDRCRRVRVEGVGVRSFHTWWQTLFLNSRDIEVAHVNLFGVGVNTDGVDIDGVRDFLVRDSFIRAEDDGLGWHALDAQANGEPITERARATDIVIWNTGAGNGIRIGASMETQLWRDILIERVDILMHKEHGIYSDYSDWAWTQDLVFRDIMIEKPSRPIAFKVVKTHYSNATGFLDERGHIERLVFDNVRMNGGAILLQGADASHRIDQVWFNNCVNAGAPVASLADIRVNEHVTGVRFNSPVPPRPATPPGRHEAEGLESASNGRPQITYADVALSGGKARVLLASAAGDHIEYVVEGLAPGAYRLSAGVRRTPGSANFKVEFGGAALGGEQRLYASESGAARVELGEVRVAAAGDQRVRLTVSGREAASTGWRVDLDYLEFTPLSAAR